MIAPSRSLVFVLFCVSACATPSARGVYGPPRGLPFPPFTFERLGAPGAVSLDAFQGKAVLVDLWASWCAPCKEELPQLDELAKRLASDHVPAAIVAVSVDDDRADALGFLRSRAAWAVTFAHDPKQTLPTALQPEKMPSSYLVDRHGVVQEVISGYRAADLPRLEARIRAVAASN